MTQFNWVDLLLIIMLLIGMVVGYAQGLIRQIIGLAAVYVALVIATQFFIPLSQAISSLTLNQPSTLSNATSFFVILLIVIILLNILGQDAFRRVRFSVVPLLDRLGGMILGVVSMWVLLTVVVNVLTFAINAQSWGTAESYRFILDNGISNSRVAAVTDTTLPMIVAAIRPWLPTSLPALFEL